MKRRLALILALLLCLVPLFGCGAALPNDAEVQALLEALLEEEASPADVLFGSEDGLPEEDTALPEAADAEADGPRYGEPYSDRDGVAAYLHLYGELPPNYITKNEAKALGWDSEKGNLWDVAPNRSIGGDRFGNREGRLPDGAGREWRECDIDYAGGYRGAARIVFSNDGLIYYTDDHYNSFTCLYGE